jgi:23S rRNA (guanosine2251-2'-O)-methyltransferase
MNFICGINPVLEAFAAGSRHFERLLIVKGLRNRRVSEAVRRASQLSVPLRFETRETLDRIAGGVPHQGIIAVVSEKPVMSLEALLGAARDPALVAVLDGVEDPRNLGAILRTVEAAGGDGVVLPERHSAGLSETVARASAGALEHLRVARVGNVVQALEALKARGLWVVGFDSAGGERWDAVDLKRPMALVFGGEGRGMRRLVREHCDHLVSLPLFGHVASLNVAVAAGIALYEAVRQRGSVPSHVRPIPVGALSAPPRVFGPSPDDSERDPGAQPLPDSPRDGDDEDGGALEQPVSLVQFQEEDVAWAGPTVLKPLDFRRRWASGEGHRSRPGGSAQARQARAGDAGRRRGRQRRPRSLPPGSASRPSGGAGTGPPQNAGPAAALPDAPTPGADGSAPKRRRRRRRRR